MITKLAKNVVSLFDDQLNDWELARNNYASLQDIRVKAIPFDNFEIMVQFNPKRIISSSAKVDPQSISNRPCFLCEKNRPLQQQGITYKDDFVILVNPYPVFLRHLTIPTCQHQPQRIQGKFGMMLQLARDLPGFSIIYNGPKCGASAPDHFHFQAIQKGVLPIETDFSEKSNCRFLGKINGMELFTRDHYLRKVITIRGINNATIEDVFNKLHGILTGIFPSDDEPMLNIVAGYEHASWMVHVFPRKQHRPRQYFESGERQLLLSPASIDMGGVLIMPRENDFCRITKADIADIFSQVCIDETLLVDIVQALIN